MHFIKVGTLLSADNIQHIPQIISLGFESISLTFWQNAMWFELEQEAPKIMSMLGDSGVEISTLTVFGNPLTDDESLQSWKRCIDAAHLYKCSLVTGFSGRVHGNVEQSMPRYREVYSELSKRAADKGVRLAFENCKMDGNWEDGSFNIAMYPRAWEMMFNEVPADNIGLEWEPCHQMVNLIDPIAQLRKWVKKVFHVHGKDATIAWDVIREHGIDGPHEYIWHRTPGFGDTNWSDICTILMQNDYTGTIDIEGWHDPVFKDNLEYTGQVQGLKYLKQSRGGEIFVPNPA